MIYEKNILKLSTLFYINYLYTSENYHIETDVF